MRIQEHHLASRGITTLMHFTAADNLPEIVERGLLPVTELKRLGVGYKHSDSSRLDGYPDAISLSVTCCNWPMFLRVRKTWPGRRMVILGLDARLLLDADCMFCPGNAATGQYIGKRRKYSSVNAFRGMFENHCPYPKYRGNDYRKECGIPKRLATDPQAEILHFGRIAPEWIRFAIVDDEDLGREVDALLNSLDGDERWVHARPKFRRSFGLQYDPYPWGMADPADPDFGDEQEEAEDCDFSQAPL